MKRISNGDTVFYEYARDSRTRVLLVSTAASRRLLTDPVVVGSAYRSLLERAVQQVVQAIGSIVPSAERTAVLTVLRGGLSFGVDRAIAAAERIEPSISFVGTTRDPTNRVDVVYPRWCLGGARRLVLGDIIGTGQTMIGVLHEAIRRSALDRDSLREVVLLTIGSRIGVNRVLDWLRSRPGAPISCLVVAFEALFELPKANWRGGYPRLPFDLLRGGPAVCPEYEAERLTAVGSLLERCAIYDGGVRSFAPAEHEKERSDWWDSIAELDVELGQLADELAGLSMYRQGFVDFQRRFAWMDEDQATHLYQLGASAAAFCAGTATADYLDTVLVRRALVGLT